MKKEEIIKYLDIVRGSLCVLFPIYVIVDVLLTCV